MAGAFFTRQFWIDLYGEINDDNVWNGAAALAYYLTLSIFPAFIVIFTIIPYLPIQDVDQALMDLLRQALPGEAAQMLEGTIAEITQQQRGGLLSFGILFTLWTVSTGMYAIMQQLNITYDVQEGRSFILARLVAILLSVAFVALVIGAFALVVLGGVFEQWVMSIFGDNRSVVVAFQVFRWLVIVLALLLGFALIYKYAPNVDQRFRFISPGSVLGALLLIVASLAFTVYIQNFGDYDATYGSLGAVIILMLWLYIVGLVLLLGSEINSLVEHYSPEGKVKGEKEESGRSGDRLRDEEGDERRDVGEREVPAASRSGAAVLIPLAALLVLEAFRSRRGRPVAR
jgi:membrane protein